MKLYIKLYNFTLHTDYKVIMKLLINNHQKMEKSEQLEE